MVTKNSESSFEILSVSDVLAVLDKKRKSIEAMSLNLSGTEMAKKTLKSEEA
jgi:hypothetical protein